MTKLVGLPELGLRPELAQLPEEVDLPFVVHGAQLDLRRDDMIRPAELIQRKRDGEELADEELAELVLGYARGEVPDYQMAAFCMAVFFRGLSVARRTC